MATKKRPPAAVSAPSGPPCPKCGSAKGWAGPSYQQGRRVTVLRPTRPNSFRATTVETTESLTFTCNHCGYTRHEACITTD